LSWFVYWRVHEADAEAAEAAVLRWQTTLKARVPTLEATLWRKPESASPGLITLMEIYSTVPAALESELVAGAPLAAWQQGARHVERFVPVSRAAG
jgi:Domain of unknown function (DUF4936)